MAGKPLTVALLMGWIAAWLLAPLNWVTRLPNVVAGLAVAIFLLWRYAKPPASSAEAEREGRDFSSASFVVQFAFVISVLAIPVWPFETQAAATGRMVLTVLLILELFLLAALRVYEGLRRGWLRKGEPHVTRARRTGAAVRRWLLRRPGLAWVVRG